MRTSPGANRLRLVRLLIEEGPRHRAEIARALGTSRATVTTLVQQLTEEGVLDTGSASDSALSPVGVNGSTAESGNGAGPVRLKRPIGISTARGVIVQLLFRSTITLAAVTAIDGRVLASSVRERQWSSDAAMWLDAAKVQVQELLKESSLGWADVFHIHLAVNSQVDRITGTIIASDASGPWRGVDPVSTARMWAGCTVSTENTARQIALAEYSTLGEPRPLAVVYLYLTWGIGMGHIFDGRIVTGSRGAAGELGHISIDPHGEPCPCGNRGCLSRVAGLDNVLRLASAHLGRHVGGIDEVVEAARAGDRDCVEILQKAGEQIGTAMRTVCHLLAPDVLIVGGETARADDLLIAPMRRELEAGALPLAIAHLRVVRAAAEDDPAALFRAGHGVLVGSNGIIDALTQRALGSN